MATISKKRVSSDNSEHGVDLEVADSDFEEGRFLWIDLYNANRAGDPVRFKADDVDSLIAALQEARKKM